MPLIEKNKRKSIPQVVPATYEMLNPYWICYDNQFIALFIVAYSFTKINLCNKKIHKNNENSASSVGRSVAKWQTYFMMVLTQS